ncbi:pyridoxamine 5'-phosphate oxidase [Mangrovivirga cuniculi]|uniref:Pyridoxine/pyridoxamine 5'-phosphate oxidase n=1 Tax=Mangrovivirga cuniculi TaxID=2715131 RepID=A0A4D7K940_9BACT|nr:pyridoxamine 5'-phosphate oxidase [Mangrovivirga cuniculi]QCK15818.1 pyridoxamine 5'-phosphate oxidase [Mangrovivirga cuniculi]
MDIADIRKEYSRHSLNIDGVDKDAVKQFEKWFEEAAKSEVLEPNAMSLSTITADGRPSCRIVLLKGISNGGFEFFTNYQSKKGLEIDENPWVALTFFWGELERQVRIEGIAERLTEKESEDYFNSRPEGSKIGAWVSPQSQPIASRVILDERHEQVKQKFDGKTVTKPKQWGGYRVKPVMLEFWQGRPNRLHDRISYNLQKDFSWKVTRLAP